MRLSRSALPPGSSSKMIESAVEAFSCSVAKETQSGYATAARHYLAAEKALGRPFAMPPKDEEMVFLVTFLLNKNLACTTIRSYLAGIRFYLLSHGIATPPPLPVLAEQILCGFEKASRNPEKAAAKKTKRAITVEMLKLLEHAIATHPTWSPYERSLRWSVFLVAWWGSFRIGELLPKTKHNFSRLSTLIASDITSHEESVAFWIRSPKVERQDTGDVVEVKVQF